MFHHDASALVLLNFQQPAHFREHPCARSFSLVAIVNRLITFNNTSPASGERYEIKNWSDRETHAHISSHVYINIVSGAQNWIENSQPDHSTLALFPKRNCTFMKVHIKNTKLLRTPQRVSEWVSDILLASLLIPLRATSTHSIPYACCWRYKNYIVSWHMRAMVWWLI